MKIHLRTIVKGILWEVLGIFLAFIVFRELKEIGTYFFIRILLYYPFHRIFKKIKFNKEIEFKK